MGHKDQMPIKEDLAQWVANALKRALSIANITKEFQVTGIYSINATAMHEV